MRTTQKIISTCGSSPIGAKFCDTPFTPYYPSEPLLAAPHLTEHVPIAPLTGAFQPNGKPRYEFPLEVDIISKLNFRVRLQRLGNTGGTYARYINWIGLFCWEEIRVKYGTETLQKIHPTEIFCKIQKHYNDEERANLARLLGGNLTPVQRSQRALHEQEIMIPVLTCLNLHLYGDPSGSFFVRGLGEKIVIEVDLRPFDRWVEADEAATAVTVDGVAFSSAGNSAVIVEAECYPEGKHIYDNERQRLAELYSQSRRMVFQDYQIVNDLILPATLSAGQTSTHDLAEITQPTAALYVLLRWQEDLDRVTNAAGPTGGRGYNPTNVGGWYQPGGLNIRPIISHLEVIVGSNNSALRQIRVEDLIEYEHCRSFKGTAGIAIPSWSYSHDATRENAVLGFIDPSQMDKPRIRFYVQDADPDNVSGLGAGAVDTIGEASTTDNMAASSALVATVVAQTVNQINADMHQLRRPYN